MTDHQALIPLIDVPKHLPKRKGKRVNISSVYRWVNRGLSGVRLDTQAGPYGTYTTQASLDRFWQEVTVARRHRSVICEVNASTAHKRAMKQLDGLLT